jgi:hypothetical protein
MGDLALVRFFISIIALHTTYFKWLMAKKCPIAYKNDGQWLKCGCFGVCVVKLLEIER